MDTNNLVYQKNYIPYQRDELIGLVNKSVTGARFEHILRVEQTAIDLAEKFNIDVEKTSIAALLHDYAKQRSDHEFTEIINNNELPAELLDYGNAIWHGIVGAEIIKNELKIYDEEILNAVRHHTIGAPGMKALDQAIFMADYLEPARDFNGVDFAREITSQSLEQGVTYQLKSTMEYLAHKGVPIYPKMIDSYNYWVERAPIKDIEEN